MSITIMKIKVLVLSFLTVVLVLPAQSETTVDLMNPKPATLPKVNSWRAKVKSLKNNQIKLAEGINLDITQYMEATNLKKSPTLKKVFEPDFQRKYLTKPPQYTEDLEILDDRVVVTRTLMLEVKKSGNKESEKPDMLYFRPTGKKVTADITKDLDQYRKQLRKVLSKKEETKADRQKFAMLQDKFKAQLAMNDKELLGYLLNENDDIQTITHESVLPRVIYKFGKVPNQDLFDLKKPLSRNNSITSLEQALSPVAAKQFRHVPDTTRANISLPERTNRGSIREDLSRAATREWPEETYTFPNEHEVTAKVLAGFTIGREFGDKYEHTFARATSCLGVHLTDRYFVRFKWNINAGFGIRWPFNVKAKSRITKVFGLDNRTVDYPASGCDICLQDIAMRQAPELAHLCAKSAEVTLMADGIDAGPEFYREVGLQNKVFGGKEFVFELNASCRFYASIPGPNIGPKNKSWNVVDLGQHYSSQLGNRKQTLVSRTFKGHDYGLELSYLGAYAALNPGIQLNADEGCLKFRANGKQTIPEFRITETKDRIEGDWWGNVRPYHVKSDARGNWGVDFELLNYTVEVALTPTIGASVGIDLSAYEKSWDFGPYPIDALEISLGEFRFDRHDGTSGLFSLPIGTRP